MARQTEEETKYLEQAEPATRISQKRSRLLITQRGFRLTKRTRVLLQKLIAQAWSRSRPQTIPLTKLTKKEIRKRTQLSNSAFDKSLRSLGELGLVTVNAAGIAVHCEPMQTWETRRARSKRRRLTHARAQQRLRDKRKATAKPGN